MFEKLLQTILGAMPAAVAPYVAPDETLAPVIGETADQAASSADAEARRAEKERMRLILESDEARGRARQAAYLATATDLTPEAALAILAVGDREAGGMPTISAEPTAREVSAAQHADFFARHRAELLTHGLTPPLQANRS